MKRLTTPDALRAARAIHECPIGEDACLLIRDLTLAEAKALEAIQDQAQRGMAMVAAVAVDEQGSPIFADPDAAAACITADQMIAVGNFLSTISESRTVEKNSRKTRRGGSS